MLRVSLCGVVLGALLSAPGSRAGAAEVGELVGGKVEKVVGDCKFTEGPAWHPDGKRLIFASNIHDPKQRNFDLYLINLVGTGLERVTFNDTFDGFPMFSPDGKRIVFASNRSAKSEGETNVFIAEWVN